MLRQLHIRDLVIVHRLDLELNQGMTALTGETGAGKSILIDALGLALGGKADNSLVRTGCERAEVTAVFDVSDHTAALHWLRDHDLDADQECLLRRVLARAGRSRAFINGTPVPTQSLRELGELLIDIHGQHAHQSLLRRTAQRRLLDAYGGHERQVEQVAQRFDALRDARRELERLRSAAEDRVNRMDFLRFQLQELTALALEAGEFDALIDEQRKLANAERLRGDSFRLHELLYESDAAVQQNLARAVHTLSELAQLDPALREALELLQAAEIQVDEAAGAIRDYADEVDLDPSRLAEVDDRLAKAHELARKHRAAPESLPAMQQQMARELADLENADQALDALRESVEQCWLAYAKAAKALTKARISAAKRLAITITDAMQGLAMTGGRFDVAVASLSVDQAGANGLDDVEFQVSANPGQPLAPLAKVASGGELSRISLAVQVATAGCGEVPTLIFDEVDVGIGGAVAEMIGQLLRDISGSRQILCITHLPQVAAQCHHHLQVSKLTDGKTTQTRVVTLTAEERVHEIARMLGGVAITPQTLAHADEMISKSRAG